MINKFDYNTLYESVGRSGYAAIHLDHITNNINIMRKNLDGNKTGIIAVVKAGGYGHGSIMISNHLKSIGVERLAVATVQEGIHLRNHKIIGPIHILGNGQSYEMADCIKYNLIPTISSVDILKYVVKAKNDFINYTDTKRIESDMRGFINIKVDTGMSRNGCQIFELNTIIKECDKLNVKIDGIFTHFYDSWDNEKSAESQFKTFIDATNPYNERNFKLHVSNSGGILNKIGTNLDFVRPGIAMYGLCPGGFLEKFKQMGFKPTLSLHGHPTLVKQLKAGRLVGYGGTYVAEEGDVVATIPIGYADGYWRNLSNGKGNVLVEWSVNRKEICPIIGRVSMDAITIKLPKDLKIDEHYSITLITADYNLYTSMEAIAKIINTLTYEVATRISLRVPRVYLLDGKCIKIAKGLDSFCY